METQYSREIKARTKMRYLKGLLIRWWTNFKYERARRVARRNGATIGKCVVLPMSLARKANSNLVVGSHTSIQTDRLDLRNPIHIGSHVIIGTDTEILTTSHDIDSRDFAVKNYGIVIDDYAWLPTRVSVLPSCRHIGQGAVIGSGSVVVRDVEPMAVMSGTPAQLLRYRKCVHEELVVESLLGGDYEAYREARCK